MAKKSFIYTIIVTFLAVVSFFVVIPEAFGGSASQSSTSSSESYSSSSSSSSSSSYSSSSASVKQVSKTDVNVDVDVKTNSEEQKNHENHQNQETKKIVAVKTLPETGSGETILFVIASAALIIAVAVKKLFFTETE